jgi:hypothetical protein
MSTAKLHIATMEGPKVDVTAQYNPKELGIEKAVSWNAAAKPQGDTPTLEFTAGTNRSMTLELTFDGYEDGKNVHSEYVEKLTKMAMAIDEHSSKPDLKRPPKVQVIWGSNKLPNFVGVIESVSTKYTMFLPDGTPVRATCNVKLKEASKLSFKKGS